MSERVQLNISITLEQKLALQALAEGHGTSVTKLVLGLIEQGDVPVAVSQPSEVRRGVEAEPDPEPWVIEGPADVPRAVERVAPGRSFSPYSKEQQTGKGKPSTKTKPVVTISTCRHGLMRCKVCGTG